MLCLACISDLVSISVIRASELPARVRDRHLVVGVDREVPQRASGVLLLHGRAIARERHERLDAALARNRHLVVVCMRVNALDVLGGHEMKWQASPKLSLRVAISGHTLCYCTLIKANH